MRGLPSRFGFALAVPAAEAETLFTVPIEEPEYRCVPRGFRMARSRDGGKNWKLLSRGLPQRNANCDAARGPGRRRARLAGLYVGRTNGQVFYTRDAGDSWSAMAEALPGVLSMAVATQ